jgi:hypothetical protein
LAGEAKTMASGDVALSAKAGGNLRYGVSKREVSQKLSKYFWFVFRNRTSNVNSPDETNHDAESARRPVRGFFRGLVFTGKFLFDIPPRSNCDEPSTSVLV